MTEYKRDPKHFIQFHSNDIEIKGNTDTTEVDVTVYDYDLAAILANVYVGDVFDVLIENDSYSEMVDLIKAELERDDCDEY